MGGKLWDGMAWCGWFCFCRPYPHPLPPVPLWGPSWEDSLFWAGRRSSERMSECSGGILQWPLFVYTSQRRHTSLAARSIENLWCSNHRRLCSCTETKSLGGLSPCLVGHSWYIYTNTNTVLPSVASADGAAGCFIVGQEAQGTELTSAKQQQSQTLLFHHRDVRHLPPRDRQIKTGGLFGAAIFWQQI